MKAKIILGPTKRGTKTENSEYYFHISSNTTNGKICIYEAIFINPRKNINLHYHKILTETFTVLEGEFYFNLDNVEFVLNKNDSVVVPPYVIHGFNAKLPFSKLQIAFIDSPNRDRFFIELARLTNERITLSDAERQAFLNRYDQYEIN